MTYPGAATQSGPGSGSVLRRLRAGVRGRSAAWATLLVAVVMVAGSTVLVLLLQAGVRSDVRAAAAARVGEVSARVHEGTGRMLRRDVELHTHEGQLTQVIGPGRRIVAASSARAAGRPLTPLRPAPGVTRSTRVELPALGGNRSYLVLVRGVRAGGATWTVVVASSLETVTDSVETLVAVLLAALPLTLLLVAAGTWVLVGRALGPVEEIRGQVARIESSDLTARVPVPVTHDEVQRLADTMNQMLARLEQGQLRQRRFVADASHELRSPLTTLSAALELAALDRRGPTSQEESHAVMQAEVARMQRLVDDLLLLARADHDELRVVADEVDLDDVVRAECSRLRAGHRDDLDVQARIDPVRVAGDPHRLGQLVRNLLDNAAHAAAGTVRVSLSSSGTSASLLVEDDGPGIRPEDRARVFERFVRLDPGRSRHRGGSGLGLAIVREIARSHRATVVVGDSSLGGARFELRIACEQNDLLPMEDEETQAGEGANVPPSGSRR